MLPTLAALPFALPALGWLLLAFLSIVRPLGSTSLDRPSPVLRSRLLDTVTGISATETDSTAVDTRGMRSINFVFLSTLNTGYSAGTVYFKGSIVGSPTQYGTYTPVPGLETAELVVDVGQTVPSAANAPGVILPRWIKVKWTETGSMSSFTGTCRMFYEMDPTGPGKQYSADYLGG